ncbi:MAG TPA: universal stress protein, partial [Kofleriaceae bacterium]|nr:universal stress protein [Kofleriaceae bacterium]
PRPPTARAAAHPAPAGRSRVVKRIFVALDASPRAPAVLAAAGALAELADAKLIVFRAVTIPPDLPPQVLEMTDLRLEDFLLRNARTDLERLTAGIPRARIEKIATAFATPWDGICRAAKEERADLIVIGSHGYGGLDRLLGTTAGKVVNHADRNVLVVRTPL